MMTCFEIDIIFYIDGLVQGRRNSIADVLELLQSCTKPRIISDAEAQIFRLTTMILIMSLYY